MDSTGHRVLRALGRRGLPILRPQTSGPPPRASGARLVFVSEPIRKGLRHCSSGIMLKGKRTEGWWAECLSSVSGGVQQAIKLQILLDVHAAPAPASSYTGTMQIQSKCT